MLELEAIVGDARTRMNPLHTIRALIMTLVGLVAALIVSMYAGAAQPPVTKASDWLGHAVVTRDGKDLGTVRDFAINKRTGKVVYLVVSVGSFLIENNLIAVDPDALVRAPGDPARLLLEADPDTLHKAKRFASDSDWPSEADVVRVEGGRPAAAPAGTEASESQAVAPPPTGTATIESRSKTAHLSASERVITETSAPAPPPASVPTLNATAKTPAPTASRLPAITPFDKLDKDGDGVLNRSEFAHVISPKDNYTKIDANANGVIDSDEFDVYEAAHGAN